MDHGTYLRKRLADLLERHRLEAKPIIDELVKLEALKAPPPMIVSAERARELGFDLAAKGVASDTVFTRTWVDEAGKLQFEVIPESEWRKP
jgi:hypothetical protein